MTLHDVRPAEEARSPGPPLRRAVSPALVGGVAVVLLLLALLARFVLAGSGDAPVMAAAGSRAAANSATAIVDKAQQALRAHPDDPVQLTRLGFGYLSRARETADPTYYTRAGEALDRSRQLRPDDVTTLIGLGLLDLSRHEFVRALETGQRALSLDPSSATALGVIVDAQVELGRYPDAVASAQRMVDLKPNLASYARVSYLRELHGDPAGALSAMTSAVVAGSGSPNDLAYVQTLLGDLHLAAGRLAAAEQAYSTALRSVPAYGLAEIGLARVEAARGDLGPAADRLAGVTARLPLPAAVALYGDVLAARGDTAGAEQQYALVRATEQLATANGVVVDFETARFEADHARDPGARPQDVVALARAAYAARPTVYGHDALAWALRQAGQPGAALPEAQAALALGTRDALLWYHRAVIEADLGMTAAAGSDLATAFEINASLSVRDLPPARELAGRLGVAVPPVDR